MPVTTQAIRIHQTGGPGAMTWQAVEVPDPAPGQVRLRHTVVGLNFIDINQRSGTYPLPGLPATLGMEAAGVVDAVGDGVDDFVPGDRVSHCMNLGAYAQFMVIDARQLIRLPDTISDEIAAAVTLQGLTAHYLLHDLSALRAGQTVLVHAAAGGVGLLLCQWARHIGATVIGTVGSEDKAELAVAHGCDHPVLYSREDFTERVKEITDGKGADAILDAIGKDTFIKGLGCLAARGRMISYGVASGPIGPVDINVLRPLSASITCGGLRTFTKDPVERGRNADTLFGLIADGTLKVEINQRYPLADAARAHADLEARRTTGSSVLTV
jgi:NADPH2:quinone reductase